MTKVMYKAEIFQEGDCFVGLCRELDVSSSGDTPEDADASLQKAVKAFLDGREHLGTLDDVLAESGFDKFGDMWKLRERIVEEKIVTIQESKKSQKKKKRVLGLHASDGIWMSDDFDEPLPGEFWFGESELEE